MPNREIKTFEVVDCIDRNQVLKLLNRKINFYSEPPVDISELNLLYELKKEIEGFPTLKEEIEKTCKDCLHEEVCSIDGKINVNECKYFKDKAKYKIGKL